MDERPLQLHRLEGFYWVGRERGYAAGARAYPHPISQPGIYQQVKKLEADLGTALLERVGKAKLRLTPAGERLFAFCAPFFEQLPRVTRAIRARAFGGSLRIDASAVVIRELLPRWLPALREARPDIRAEVSEVTDRSERSKGSLGRLLAGEVDLILDFLDPFGAVPPSVASRVVGRCHTFLVLAADHPLAGDRRLELESLRELPFVSYQPGQHHFDVQMRAVRSAIGEPNRSASASNVDAILELVRAGLGYSAIPWLDAGGPTVPGIRAYRQQARFPIHAAWLASECPHPLVEAALATLPKV